MTIEYDPPLVKLKASGAGQYDFDYLIYSESNVKVTHVSDIGVSTELEYLTDYTVVKNIGIKGGHVDISVDYTDGAFDIRRVRELTQDIQWSVEGYLNLDKIEQAFDSVVMMIQQIDSTVKDGSSISNWRGAWTGGVKYESKDIVQAPNENWYFCNITHVSSTGGASDEADFQADLADGYWILAVDKNAISELKDAAIAAQAAAELALAEALIANQEAQEAVIITTENEESCAIAEANTAANAQNVANCAQSAYDSSQVALAVANDFIPVGTIVAWKGGYFTNTFNGGFTNVIGNDAATINARINASGWYVCNGAACNVAGSPVYDGDGRYLANLTDNRFIQGSTSAGITGGANTMSHVHGIQHVHNMAHYHTMLHSHSIIHTHTTGNFALQATHNGPHTHSYTGAVAAGTYQQTAGGAAPGVLTTGSSGSGTPHNHGPTSGPSTGDSGPNSVSSTGVSIENTGSSSAANSGAATYAENRPRFLSCWYIEKVI